MIDFTPFRSIRDKLLNFNKNIKINIDTLRTVVYKKTIRNYIDKKGFVLKKVQSHSRISINAKKQLWTKEVTSSYYLTIPLFKNIILTTPHKLNQQSSYKSFLLTAYGLFQPTMPLQMQSKKELAKLFDKFKVKSFDLTIDSPSPLMSLEDLRSFGMINTFHNTHYVNNPPKLQHISKIKLYDKAKQLLNQQGVIVEDLYRVELTIKTKGKLRDMFIPLEEIKAIFAKFDENQTTQKE